MEIGSRVIALGNMDGFSIKGLKGVITTPYPYERTLRKGGKLFGVTFDTAFYGGHKLDGTCKNGHGLWVYESLLGVAYDEDWV